MKIYFAADHAGFELKNELMNYVRGELALEVEDCGAFTMDPADDYPLFIGAAAQKLSDDAKQGIESRAVVIGASGQGEAIAANRFKGVRCALYYGAPAGEQTDMSGKQLDMIASARQHNDANALSLGARFISVEDAKAVVKKWLETPFSGEERHARRIRAIDSQYMP
jgi:ribose 5-phosphate isomerase B